MSRPPWIVLTLAFCWLTLAPVLQSAGGLANVFAQKILVANRPGFDPDAIIDELMVNPWGIALRPPGAGGHFWVANWATLSTSTFVGDANGVKLHQDGLKLVYLNGPLISY